MTEFADSAEELQLKLQQYKQQLQAVDDTLKLHPEEESLIKLQAELREIISLTEDLIQFKQQNEEEVEEIQTGIADIGISLQADGASLSEATESASGVRTVPPTQPDLRAKKLESLIGRTCQAPYENKPYFAEILKIYWSKRLLSECALVEFVGWGNRAECLLTQLKLLQPPPPSACLVGARMQGIYAEDGKWYDCIIDELTANGCKVTFTDYGNSEELKIDRIRIPISSRNPPKRVKEIVTPGGYRIPEYLMIKPTDDEHQKQLKRKKVLNLKKEQRITQIDEEANNRASSWRKFNNKAKSKKVSGIFTGRSQQSIFKSSDTPIDLSGTSKASKNQIGVFLPRRKHDYQSNEEEGI